MDERTPIQGVEEPPTRPAKRRGRQRVLAMLAPLLFCLLGVGLIVPPALLARRLFVLPVTGAGATRTPRQNSDPLRAATPTRRPGSPAPGADYRRQMEDRLSVCMVAFHDFYLLQEMATRQAKMFATPSWREDGSQAMEAFGRDCEQLGALPDAPPIYSEVDRWLKKAASEVGPATGSFRAALDQGASGGLSTSMDHLKRFMAYTRKAEAALLGLKDRREL